MSEQDAEIAALRDVAVALEPLDGDMRLRVLNWARQRFVTDPSLDAVRSQLGLRKPTRETSLPGCDAAGRCPRSGGI